MNPGSVSSGFYGVAATAGCNAWAVGDYQNGPGPSLSLVEQWNGTAWTVQSSPNPGSYYNDLGGVAATSATNVWAVGFADAQTLIEHWNGTAWSVQPSPSPGAVNELRGVAATSPTNAWAVGDQLITPPNERHYTLIEHWDGTAWSVQPSPNPAPHQNFLYSVAATSTKNAWAVGRTGSDRTVVEHWGGKTWKLQPSRNHGGRDYLEGVAATSTKNAWAVGGSDMGVLIEHWNGKAWKLQRSPDPRFTFLYSVVATSSKNAWAVGTYSKSASAPEQTRVEHWNGKAWKIQRSPNPAGSSQDNVLTGVAATSPTNAWTVGNYLINGGPDTTTLALHWDGSAWKG